MKITIEMEVPPAAPGITFPVPLVRVLVDGTPIGLLAKVQFWAESDSAYPHLNLEFIKLVDLSSTGLSEDELAQSIRKKIEEYKIF